MASFTLRKLALKWSSQCLSDEAEKDLEPTPTSQGADGDQAGDQRRLDTDTTEMNTVFELVTAFLADTTATKLELPALNDNERKKVKEKLAEKHPEIKCESYGFGAERRLHLFKVAGKTKVKESLTQFLSEGSTVVPGPSASPEGEQDPPTEEVATRVSLPTCGYQVRNTFIHFEEAGTEVVTDQRAVQFSQCLSEEAEKDLEPTPTLKETFAPGTEVVIKGLVKDLGFNGLHATVLSLDRDMGRYQVQLSSADGSTGQMAKIKPENLRMTVPPPPPFESTAGRAAEDNRTMRAEAPEFVPTQCMGMTSVPQLSWALYDPMHFAHYFSFPHSYPTPAPPVLFAHMVVRDKIACLFPSQFSEVYPPSNIHAVLMPSTLGLSHGLRCTYLTCKVSASFVLPGCFVAASCQKNMREFREWARSVWMWQKISLWFSVASLPSGTSPTRSEKCVASTCAEWSDCCRPSGLLWHGA
eukprot:symbB.v1.2.019843.t2/scaffold1644.1/size164340/13